MLDEKALDALRQRKEIPITNTMKVIVKEFTAAEVLKIISFEKISMDASLDEFMLQFEEYVPLCLEGATIEELRQLPPSKLKEIWIAFKECNSVFFDLAQTLGLSELGGRLRSAFVNDFLRIYVGSRKLVMSKPLTTATPTS